jgi:hypothetical protein
MRSLKLEASEHGDARVTERYRKVAEARLSRLAALGQMAGGVAAGALGEGMRQLARGERPRMTDLLLTPGNARAGLPISCRGCAGRR